MAAAERGFDRLRLLDAFDQQVDAVAAPEQLAVEYHGRHAEHAERLSLVDDAVMLGSRRTADIGFKIFGSSADIRDDAGNFRQLVDFQLVTPEAFEHRV